MRILTPFSRGERRLRYLPDDGLVDGTYLVGKRTKFRLFTCPAKAFIVRLLTHPHFASE